MKILMASMHTYITHFMETTQEPNSKLWGGALAHYGFFEFVKIIQLRLIRTQNTFRAQMQFWDSNLKLNYYTHIYMGRYLHLKLPKLIK